MNESDRIRLKMFMILWKEFILKQKLKEWYENKQEEQEEKDFAEEHFPNEPEMWCESCRIGVCPIHSPDY